MPSVLARAIRLAPELLEVRTTPTITFGHVSGSYIGTGLGENSQTVAVGDLNGDGLPDVILGDTNGLNVLMNQGNGVYKNTGPVTFGGFPTEVQLVDASGRGELDMVVLSDFSSEVAVIPGNGDGTFGTPQVITFPSQPQDMAIADLNGDGLPDVVVTMNGGMAVMMNDGSGGLSAPTYYNTSASGGPSFVAVGDFKGDGKPEVAVSVSSSDLIDIYPNEGNGTFGTPSVIQDPKTYSVGYMTVGDFNNDGRLDLAVNYMGTAAIGILEGNGNGTFKAPIWTNTGISGNGLLGHIAAADFDKDGNLDLAYISNNGAVILPGKGNGRFGTAVPITGGDNYNYGGSNLAIGDVNGDGYPDFITAGFGVALNASIDSKLASFDVSTPASVSAGVPFTVAVTAVNTFGNTLTSYDGAIDLSISDSLAEFPSEVRFTADDDGAMSFTVTLKSTGSQSIGVVDSSVAAATGTTSVAVDPGTASAGNSTFTIANSTDASGTADAATIVLRDAYGHAISGLTTSDFQFALSGGTSTGSFGTVTETTTPGTYTVDFVGLLEGSALTATVSVDGRKLTSKPTVAVSEGAPDADRTTLQLAFPTIASAATDLLTIVARDAAGNPVTDLTNQDFSFDLLGGTSTGSVGTVTQMGTSGIYKASLTGLVAGTPSSLSLTLASVSVASEATLEVTPGAVSSADSRASFASSTDQSGTGDTATIVLEDANGNAISGLTDSAFSFTLVAGTSTGSFGTVQDTSTPGTYTVNFNGVIAGSASTLKLKARGVALATQPVVIVSPGVADPARTTVRFATPTVASGRWDTATISVRDAVGNAVSGLSSSDFAPTLSGGTIVGTFSPVLQTSTPGVYTTRLQGGIAGSIDVLVLVVDGLQIRSEPTVQVLPGAVSAENSTVDFASPTDATGTVDLVTLVVRDAAGNAVVGLTRQAFSLLLLGKSTGTFGNFATAAPGEYIFSFTGEDAGSPSELIAKVGGIELSSNPTIQVTST